MRRPLLAALALLTLIALGLAFYLPERPRPARVPTAEQVTKELLTKPYTEETNTYRISAAYPTTTPFSGSARDAAIDAMQGWVIGEISAFKDGGPERVDYTRLPPGERATLDITFEVRLSSTTISYVFGNAEFTGGAHRFGSTKTFSFDKTTGVMLSTPVD